MDTDVKIITNLKYKIETISVEEITNISTLYVQTISDIFGKDNSFTKKAIGLASGWEVEGVWLHVNGLISDSEFQKNTYNAYLNLLDEILAYFELASANIDSNSTNLLSESTKPKIFISYNWNNTDIAQHIENSKLKEKVIFSRDVKNIGNWESISAFMKSIRTHDFAVLIISDEYIKSKNCMYEVLQILDEPDFRKMVFPVIVEKKIYEIKERINYLEYWVQKHKCLTAILEEKNLEKDEYGINDIDIIYSISKKINNFLSIVADMNNPGILDTVEAIENVLINKKIIS